MSICKVFNLQNVIFFLLFLKYLNWQDTLIKIKLTKIHLKGWHKCTFRTDMSTPGIIFAGFFLLVTPNKHTFMWNFKTMCSVLNKRYFIIEQQIALHFVQYSESLSTPHPFPYIQLKLKIKNRDFSQSWNNFST